MRFLTLAFSLLGVIGTGVFGCAVRPATPPAATAPSEARSLAKPALLIHERAAFHLARAFDLISAATAVESYRIDADVKITDDTDRTVGIAGYPILQRGPDLTAAQVRRLSSFMRDPGGYCGDVWCEPIKPGIAYRFRAGQRVLTVLVCFKCEEWQFWLDHEKLGGDTFRGLQPELLALARELFPQDKARADIKPSETFGRWYQVTELLNQTLTQQQLDDLSVSWGDRILEAVGEPERWNVTGGSEYWTIYTPDPSIRVVITRARGHDAIGKLPGIVDVTPPR